MEREALDEVFREYGPMVLRRARAILGDEQMARDAMQDVFEKALRSVAGFRGDASPVTWLYRITTNHCLNVLRDSGRRAELMRQHVEPRENVRAPEAEKLAILRSALRQVPEDLRATAIYYYVDQMSQQEIADIMGVGRRTVGYRLEAFRKAARDLANRQEVAS